MDAEKLQAVAQQLAARTYQQSRRSHARLRILRRSWLHKARDVSDVAGRVRTFMQKLLQEASSVRQTASTVHIAHLVQRRCGDLRWVSALVAML